MKKTFLILFILNLSISSNAQSLSINETIDYLNEILLSHKSGKNYQYINIKEDGKLILSYRKSNFMTIFNIVESSLDFITVTTNIRGETYLHIHFKDYAIQYVNTKNDTKSNRKWSYIRINNIDVSSAEKFANALSYLISLVKSDAKYNQINDDPFSPQNFNPNSFEIKSDKTSDKIQLSKQGGVYQIDISIGGLVEKFILDTGASDVLISKDLERNLISKGFLKEEHYLDDGLYRIADGSIVKQRRLIIPKLDMGNFTLINVKASVTNGDTKLLGKSALDKFKNWRIDNLNQTLELNK